MGTASCATIIALTRRDVLTADGAARWVDLSLINKDDAGLALFSSLGGSFTQAKNPLVDQVWELFDRQTR